MSAIHPTALGADRSDRAVRSDHADRIGILGWQRSAWGSVLLAAVIAVACQLVFTSLGFAIGVTAAEASSAGAAQAGDIGIAAGVWWLITGTISLLVGGLALGRLSGIPRSANLFLAALGVWAVTAVFGFFVVWSGMMSAASSPLAAMSAPALDTAAAGQGGVTGAEFARGEMNPDREILSAGAAAQAQDAARTASWWTVIGMLIGAGVTAGGAWISAPKTGEVVRD